MRYEPANVKHIKGFRQLAREAEARKQFDCGHDMTPENSILQFREFHQQECRKCYQDKRDKITRAKRILRDLQDPEWRARRQDKRRAKDRKRLAIRRVIARAQRDIAVEMMQ